MDAEIFNFSIQQIIAFGQIHLMKLGFILIDNPAPQEDSGDLVSTESIAITYAQPELGLLLRFFLCCGKGDLPDYLATQWICETDSNYFLTTDELSRHLGLSLHELNFNGAKTPTIEFLDTFLRSFAEALPAMMSLARERIQQLTTSSCPPNFAQALFGVQD